MDALFFFGLLFGIRHAFDADHIVAMLALNTDTPQPAVKYSNKNANHYNSKDNNKDNNKYTHRNSLIMGAQWAIGHSIVLLLFGGIMIFFAPKIPDHLHHLLEALVGVVLIIMGIQILRRIQKNKLHIHTHQHDLSPPHIHLHSHLHTPNHNHTHRHAHTPKQRHLFVSPIVSPKASSKQFNKQKCKPLLIGAIHGAAGTSALVILTAETISSNVQRFLYLISFSLGTLVGMVAFSAAISIPLTHTLNKGGTIQNNKLNLDKLYLAVGSLTCTFGLWIVYQNVHLT